MRETPLLNYHVESRGILRGIIYQPRAAPCAREDNSAATAGGRIREPYRIFRHRYAPYHVAPRPPGSAARKRAMGRDAWNLHAERPRSAQQVPVVSAPREATFPRWRPIGDFKRNVEEDAASPIPAPPMKGGLAGFEDTRLKPKRKTPWVSLLFREPPGLFGKGPPLIILLESSTLVSLD